MNKVNPTDSTDIKVRPTNLKTMGDIQNLFRETEASENEINALTEILSGQSSVANACINNGLVEGDEIQANYVNRFRNRSATILLSAFKVITAPVISLNTKLAEKNSELEAATLLSEQIKNWETNGSRGRKPGEGNRAKNEIVVEKAHAESRRQAREKNGIAAQGRITPDNSIKFVSDFRTIYHKMLMDLSKKHEEIGNAEKIEKMVNKAVKELSIEKPSTKAIKPKTQKTPKTPKHEDEVPTSDTTPEPVHAE